MEHQQHQRHLDFLGSFPRNQYPSIRDVQQEALEFIQRKLGSRVGTVIIEAPTGTGKTAVEYAFLKALEQMGGEPLFIVVPTKALVDQVKGLHPDVQSAYGRGEYPCYYPAYQPEGAMADEIPCSLLVDCPHRVNQETGETYEPGATLCPYLLAKYQAKRSRIVVCTMAFYLFTQLFSKEWETPAGLVVDEAHRIAEVFRSCLSYEITDYHLWRVVNLLSTFAPGEAEKLASFAKKMTRIVKRRPPRRPTLLEDDEMKDLISSLMAIDSRELWRKLGEAVKRREIEPAVHREVLKKTETLVRDLTRYIRSLEFSLPTERRNPLNYTYGYYEEEKQEGQKAQYRLVIKAYSVAHLVKMLLGKRTLACSATIGDQELFGWETGISGSFSSLASHFPVENTRIFIPKNTPNLAFKERGMKQPARILHTIARTCASLAGDGIRSLVDVVSEKERQQFLRFCEAEKVRAISYGNGVGAKEAVSKFKAGEGDVLVGTVAHFGEGIDLPNQLAPLIFFLRPAYPSPDDPLSQFELRRFPGSQIWKVRCYRESLRVVQVRGRNVRSEDDVGVTICISQQFRRFLYGALPAYLQEGYRADLTLGQCIEETKQLLGRRAV